MADIQYAPLPPAPPPVTPDWLKALGAWIESLLGPLGQMLGLRWGVVEVVLYILAGLLVAWLAWRLLAPWLAALRRGEAADPGWVPDQAQATALLEDAERLAREGCFAEAVHLLLQRSVSQIATARPDWLHPASTAREIALLAGLGESARRAFATIATRVERSRFALRDLDGDDWQAARDAYAAFALQPIGRGAA